MSSLCALRYLPSVKSLSGYGSNGQISADYTVGSVHDTPLAKEREHLNGFE